MAKNTTAQQGLEVFQQALTELKQKDQAPIEGLYPYQDGKVSQSRRQKDNDAATRLMRQLEQENRSATAEEKKILSRYTGKGGGLVVEGVSGSQYEYYTPKPLADQLWNLLKESGFDGGSVLDPCAGTGIFAAGMPDNAVMQSVELNEVSGKINGLVNDNDKHKTTISAFESIAASTQDNTYDAVITNVPFGSKIDRGEHAAKDIYANDDMDSYFVKRSIDKLKHGKLAVFIAHPKLMTGAKHSKFRAQISLKAELLGAYRLPNKVFEATGADVVTDVLVFRKHSAELTAKIENLYENGQVELLKEARVLDADILAGRYYKTEGLRHVLGESRMVQHAKWKTDVEAVISNDSLSNILKLIRRFPDSRIDFEGLNVIEAKEELQVKEGDIRVISGTTYEYTNGQWKAIAEAKAFNHAANFERAYLAFHTGMTYDDLMGFNAYCQSASQIAPKWVQQFTDVLKKSNGTDYNYWLVQFALYDVMQALPTLSYHSQYADLSAAMRGYSADFRAKKYKNASMRTILSFNSKAFDDTEDGLSAYWKGTKIEISQDLDVKSAYENAVYMGRSSGFMVHMDEIKAADPSFDPLSNDDYAVSSDGQSVCLNRDYYSGNHGELLDRLNAEIEAATDPALRAKLIRQRDKSYDFVDYVDTRKIHLGLRATNIDLKIKSEFLSLYGGEDVYIDAEGKVRLQEKQEPFERIARILKGAGNEDHRWVRTFFLNRILDSVNNGTALTLRVKKAEVNKEDYERVFKAFMAYANELDATFSAYLQANTGFMDELDRKINDPHNKQMKAELDTSPVDIAGFKPKFEGFEALQTYQNAEIRRLSRRFEGITGFDVGLGKTMTSIAAVRNLHNIGVKKRTMFVVPSHTISKWYRDMTMTLEDHSDVLVIGSKNNTLESVNSASYGDDLNLLIKDPKFRVVLITSDAFTMIPLMDNTVEHFYTKRSEKVDFSKDKQREKYRAFITKKTKPLQEHVGRLPYFEDLRVDSIVFDEAQMFKNGDSSEGEGNFQTIKGLSLLAEDQLSIRATSAKIKSEFVRQSNLATQGISDGVVLLSATPITNSPSEILTMLSLAVGEQKARRLLGGAAVESVDDFLSTFAHTESIEGVDLTGMKRSQETFTGFKNLELLKNALHTVANIQTARENDLKIPDQEDVKTSVEISNYDKAVLSDLKRAYNIARIVSKPGAAMGVDSNDIDFLEDICRQLGEPIDLIAHPFNLITKMQDLILMGYDAVMSRAFYIDFAPSDLQLAQKVVDEYNKKPVKISSTRSFPMVDEADTRLKKRGENMGDADEFEISVRAFVDQESDYRIGLTANDTAAIANLMKIADKEKLPLKPKLSAKMQAFIDNVKQELLHPKHNGHAKQIVFCDTLAMHHVIKQALIEHCGIERSRIAILNAAIKPNGEPGNVKSDDVQDIQDGFASDKYTFVIANKKADTGIDLQRGTQAIHHLTTGWTPDSLQQRNGRGVRQGNKQAKVRVYMYNANGTFDEYKLQVINGKSDWIDSLMDKDQKTEGTLHVGGDLSDEELDLMIQADSQEAIDNILKERDKRESQARYERGMKKTELLKNIAIKAVEAADTTLMRVARDNVEADILRYIHIMRGEEKAKDADQRQELIQQKNDLIKDYEGYIPNNTVAAWDSALRYKASEKGKPMIYTSLLNRGDTGLETDVLDLILDESDQGVAGKRAREKFQSLQRMAESSKQQLIDFADSPFSAKERLMLLEGRAITTADRMICDGDFFKALDATGTQLFGIYRVQDGKMTAMKAGGTSLNMDSIQDLKPNERGQAIAAFIEQGVAFLKNYKVFDYASLPPSARESSKFIFSIDEVRVGVESALASDKSNWIDESTQYPVFHIRHKIQRRYFWAEFNYTTLYKANADIVKAYNEIFDGIITAVEQTSGGGALVTIPNRKLDAMDQVKLGIGDTILDQIVDFAIDHNLKLNLSGAEDFVLKGIYREFESDVSIMLGKYSDGKIERIYPLETILTDEQKTEIAMHILTNVFKHVGEGIELLLSFVYEHRLYRAILSQHALDANDPEAIVKANTKLHGDLGRFKNIKLTGVAFETTGSLASSFRSRYKDDMKSYASSIGKRCEWDRRNTQWVVEPAVFLWLLKQSWFDMNQVEIN